MVEASIPVSCSPIIGIASQTLPDALKKDKRLAGKTSYIKKTYVDWLESLGARVVPLICSDSPETIEEKLSWINGVLLPGGVGDYIAMGQLIYTRLIAENDKGNVFPLWGTCLGF